MKRFSSIPLVLAAVCGLAVSGYGQTTIIDDTWADSNRTSSGPDGSGIDSQWFSSSAANLTVPGAGDMRAVVPAGSHYMTTYFPSATSPYAPAPVTLAAAGDYLRLTWTFTMTGVNAINANQNLALALAYTPGAHLAADGSPAQEQYAGYAMFLNIGQTINHASPFALKEWVLAGTGNLLGTSANWGANGAAGTLASDGAIGNAGYTNGTTYTFGMLLSRNASSGLDILTTMTGTGLNGVGGLTNSITDASPNSFAFDTFSIRPGGSTATAGEFNFSELKVEVGAVPEPSIFAMAGMGLLGAIWTYRRSRQ